MHLLIICEMITVSLHNIHHQTQSQFFLVMGAIEIYSFSNFQIAYKALLA